MSQSSSTHESMPETGPFDAGHQRLKLHARECLAQLDRTLHLLTQDVPPALAAAASLPWTGLGAAVFDGALGVNEAARGVLIDAATVSAGHYTTAKAMLEATS